MPLITSKQGWTQQPQVVLPLDTGSSLTNGLVFATDYTGRDVISGILPKFLGSGQRSLKKDGHTLESPDTSSSGIYWELPADHPLYTIATLDTIFMRANITAMSSYGVLLSVPIRAGAWAEPYIAWGVIRDGESSTATHFSGSGTTISARSLTAVIAITGEMNAYCVSRNETVASFYRNNSLVGTASNANNLAPSFVNKQPLCLFNQSNTANGGVTNAYTPEIRIYKRVLSDAERASLHNNPQAIFRPRNQRIWVPSAGGGGLSLTGSLTGQGSTLSATATNTEVHALSGVLVGAGATLSGTATRIYSLTGALTGQGATLSGSATTLESHAATGALVGAGSSLSATATNIEIHAATGSLIGAGSTLSGSSTNTPVGINASGSLVGQGATLAATATNTEVHTCTGALYGQGATLSGALTRVFSASGSLVGAGSTLSATAGNAVAVFSATGSLVGQGSTLAGSATNTETHAVSGSLTGQGASLSATAALANLHTLSGSLVGSGSILVGYASGPTTAFEASPDAIVTVINKRNRVSVISRRS